MVDTTLEAYVFLGKHGNKDKPQDYSPFDSFRSKAIELLESREGNLLFYLEAVGVDDKKAMFFTRIVEQGILPSVAYGTVIAEGMTPKEALGFKNIDPMALPQYRNMLFGRGHSFMKSQFETIDELYLAYRDRNQKPRISVAIESHPGKALMEAFGKEKEWKLAFSQGDFDEAFAKYKSSIRDIAMLTKSREQEIAFDLRKAAKGKNFMGILVRIGTNHGPIEEEFQDRGIHTQVYLIDEENDFSHMLPFNQRIREAMVHGTDVLDAEENQLPLFNSLFADMAYNLMRFGFEKQAGAPRDGEIMEFINSALPKFENHEQIEAFRQRVLEIGFPNALGELIPQNSEE
jgi:hypothetical protein